MVDRLCVLRMTGGKKKLGAGTGKTTEKNTIEGEKTPLWLTVAKVTTYKTNEEGKVFDLCAYGW